MTNFWSNFTNFEQFSEILLKFGEKVSKFFKKFTFRAVRKCENRVDLEKSEKMRHFSLSEALIQPRTSLEKSDVSWPIRRIVLPRTKKRVIAEICEEILVRNQVIATDGFAVCFVQNRLLLYDVQMKRLGISMFSANRFATLRRSYSCSYWQFSSVSALCHK